MIEHLPLAPLSILIGFLTANDVARLSMTCRALSSSEDAVCRAVGLVIKFQYGDVVDFLREDDPTWPRSALILRCAEMIKVKKIINSAAVQSYESSNTTLVKKTTVIAAKAWILAMKKRCQAYEQYVLQFRQTAKQRKKQQQQQQRKTIPNGFVDTEKPTTVVASVAIICEHDDLRPLAQCVSRSKRVLITFAAWKKLQLYASDSELRGFPVATSTDCLECICAHEQAQKEEEQRKQERFEQEIGQSVELVDLLLRKHGFPNELFSPATTPGHTHVSLYHSGGKSYFLVPRKWMNKWRKYVRSLVNDAPGPILNAELMCVSHRRSLIPPYITMFLSGFSIEQSLQATQALGTSMSAQYEIVTLKEWEALFDRYCAEFAVGFDVTDGSYHWKTKECHLCSYVQRPDRPNSRH